MIQVHVTRSTAGGERLETDELRLNRGVNGIDSPCSKGTDHLIPMFHDEGACFAPASAGRVVPS